ncbi:glycosyltransferase family 2 protein [Cellulomonas sp.]|uniref:glycosyltransferase family 2 protein n=1 Tax=Cellulomonas sp. TaxID=40001 RepID=UPI001AFDD604|nr:glycosyltransferase family 2 protein [Cellulomonas sp.]MBO9556768.1 glycosyltransferase family 2 protein [Cellulomonas sp.]
MSASSPTVTVVLPVFNAAEYVGTALRELLRQTFDDFEVVVIDDRSTDDTLSLVEQIAADDDRVRVIGLPTNGGVAHARNAALRAARGRFVWFVDVDDEWSPRFLEIMVENADRLQADVVVCGAEHRFGPALTQREDVARYDDAALLLGRDAVACILLGSGALWNKLFRREVLTGDVFPPLRSKSDHGGVIRLLPELRRVATVPETLYTYVQRDGSISNGGVPQPQNFVALLNLAEASLTKLPDPTTVNDLRARFRAMVVGRALREAWRFPRGTDALVERLPSMVPWRDLLLHVRDDRRTLVTCAAAKLSPRLARRAFRRLGRARWTPRGAV